MREGGARKAAGLGRGRAALAAQQEQEEGSMKLQSKRKILTQKTGNGRSLRCMA